MNLSIFRTWTLSLSAIIAPVGLMAQAPIHATIPFDFTVGKTILTAGDYRVKEIAPTVLSVQSMDGKFYTLVLVNGSSARAATGKVHLTFNRYGDQYFLSRISQFDKAWELPKSRTERDVVAKRLLAQRIELAAAGD